MLHRQLDQAAFALLLLGPVGSAIALDHHGHHHHYDHDHQDHTIHHLRRNLNTNRPFSPPGLCKDGDASYTVGGVQYACEADFNEKGGQCRTAKKTDEQRKQFDEDFKKWKEEKSNNGKGNVNGRRLDGCGSNGCAGIDWDGGEVVTIPTYFHIMHDGSTGRKYTCDSPTGTTGLPYSESDCKYIQDSIVVLNEGFRGVTNSLFAQNGAAPGTGVDTGIQFCLAGTTNNNDKSWYNDRKTNQMKGELDVGGMESLNIFVNNGGGYLGYAYFATSSDNNNDGVVLLNDSMPNGRSGWKYSQGDTLTHEVGHYLNLEHTHDSGCRGVGDYMDDAGGVTSNESEATYDCPVGLNNCSGDGGRNPIHNFMSYSQDSCMTEFTEGQKQRMQATYEIFRYDSVVSPTFSLAADGFSCKTAPAPPTPPTNPPTAPPAPTPGTCEPAGVSCSNGSVNCCYGCSKGNKSMRVCLSE